MASEPLSFASVVAVDAKKRVYIPIPFDPDAAWGVKRAHRVGGTVNGNRVRAVIEPIGDGLGFSLGTNWRGPCGVDPGDQVEVTLFPEGPQREDLALDIVAAFAADPEAGAFFDALAQFYRRGYLRWIDATKRRPDVRAERIAEVVRLCKEGKKERPG